MIEDVVQYVHRNEGLMNINHATRVKHVTCVRVIWRASHENLHHYVRTRNLARVS